MANVSLTVDGVSITVAAGSQAQPGLIKLAGIVKNTVPRLNNLARNQKFSAGDRINIVGGEVLTTSAS